MLVERVDHVSAKGNNVNVYDIVFDNNIIATMYSKNVAKRMMNVINAMNNDDPYTAAILAVNALYVVNHRDTDSSASKLAGLDSISTSCLHNPICLARMKTDSICKACYAGTQQARQHGLDDNNALNGYILQRVLIP